MHSKLPPKQLAGILDHELIGVTQDGIQDYVIRSLGLDVEVARSLGLGSDDYDVDSDDCTDSDDCADDRYDCFHSRSLVRDEAALSSTKHPTYLSSNPASSFNSYFPVGVDDTGFVSLRFDRALNTDGEMRNLSRQLRSDIRSVQRSVPPEDIDREEDDGISTQPRVHPMSTV